VKRINLPSNTTCRHTNQQLMWIRYHDQAASETFQLPSSSSSWRSESEVCSIQQKGLVDVDTDENEYPHIQEHLKHEELSSKNMRIERA